MLHIGPIFWFGFTCGFIGVLMFTFYTPNTPYALVAVSEVLFALGTGSIFQNSIAALQAHSTPEESSTVISVRSVLRGIGGAIGSGVSTIIVAQTLRSETPAQLAPLATSMFAHVPYSSLSGQDQFTLKNAFADAARKPFQVAAFLMMICLCLTAYIEDEGLERPKDMPQEKEQPRGGPDRRRSTVEAM